MKFPRFFRVDFEPRVKIGWFGNRKSYVQIVLNLWFNLHSSLSDILRYSLLDVTFVDTEHPSLVSFLSSAQFEPSELWRGLRLCLWWSRVHLFEGSCKLIVTFVLLISLHSWSLICAGDTFVLLPRLLVIVWIVTPRLEVGTPLPEPGFRSILWARGGLRSRNVALYEVRILKKTFSWQRHGECSVEV